VVNYALQQQAFYNTAESTEIVFPNWGSSRCSALSVSRPNLASSNFTVYICQCNQLTHFCLESGYQCGASLCICVWGQKHTKASQELCPIMLFIVIVLQHDWQ